MAVYGSFPSESGNAALDAPPPRPPDASQRAQPNMMTAGTSPGASSPEALAIGGLAMIEQGAQILSTVLPGVGQMLSQVILALRQTVPQALGGGQGAFAGGPMPPPAPEAGPSTQPTQPTF